MGVYRNTGGLFAGMISGYSQKKDDSEGLTPYQKAQLLNKEEDQARARERDREAEADDLRTKLSGLNPQNYDAIIGELVDFNYRWGKHTPIDLTLPSVAARFGVNPDAIAKAMQQPQVKQPAGGSPEAAASTTQARPSDKGAKPQGTDQAAPDPRFAAFNAMIGQFAKKAEGGNLFGSAAAMEDYYKHIQGAQEAQSEMIKQKILGKIPDVAKGMADQFAKEVAKQMGKDPSTVSWADVIGDESTYAIFRAQVVQNIVDSADGSLTPSEVDEQLKYLDAMHKALKAGMDEAEAEEKALEELMDKRANSIDRALLRWLGVNAPPDDPMNYASLLHGAELKLFRQMSVRGRELVLLGMGPVEATTQLWDEFADRILDDQGNPILTGITGAGFDTKVAPQASTIPEVFRKAWPIFYTYPAVGGVYRYDRKTDTVQWLDPNTHRPVAITRKEAAEIAAKLQKREDERRRQLEDEGRRRKEEEEKKDKESVTPTWDRLLRKLKNPEGGGKTRWGKEQHTFLQYPGPASRLFGGGRY